MFLSEKILQSCCSSELLFTKETDSYLCHPINTQQQLFVTFRVLWNTQAGIYSNWGIITTKNRFQHFFFPTCETWHRFSKHTKFNRTFKNNHGCQVCLLCILREKPIKIQCLQTRGTLFVCLSWQRIHVSKCCWWCPVISSCAAAAADWHRSAPNDISSLGTKPKDDLCLTSSSRSISNIKTNAAQD